MILTLSIILAIDTLILFNLMFSLVKVHMETHICFDLIEKLIKENVKNE